MKKTLTTLLAASTLLAGCSGDPKPPASPPSTAAPAPSSTTTSPAPTTTTSTTAPTTTSASPTIAPTTAVSVPPAGAAHTPAGAEAFVKYFFDQVNRAWTVPQPGLLPKLCKASSKSCKSFEDTAVQLKAAGHRYDGLPVATLSVAALDAPEGRQSVLFKGQQEKRNVVDGSGRVVSTDQQKAVSFEVALEWTPSGWTVFTIKGI